MAGLCSSEHGSGRLAARRLARETRPRPWLTNSKLLWPVVRELVSGGVASGVGASGDVASGGCGRVVVGALAPALRLVSRLPKLATSSASPAVWRTRLATENVDVGFRRERESSGASGGVASGGCSAAAVSAARSAGSHLKDFGRKLKSKASTAARKVGDRSALVASGVVSVSGGLVASGGVAAGGLSTAARSAGRHLLATARKAGDRNFWTGASSGKRSALVEGATPVDRSLARLKHQLRSGRTQKQRRVGFALHKFTVWDDGDIDRTSMCCLQCKEPVEYCYGTGECPMGLASLKEDVVDCPSGAEWKADQLKLERELKLATTKP